MNDIPDIPDISTSEYHSELMRFLRESSDMRSTVGCTLKQAAIASGGAIAGAILLGPVGGLVGGIIANIVGFVLSDDYDGVITLINKLPPERKNVS